MPRFALGRGCALGIGETVVSCPAWGIQNFLEVGCEIRAVPTLGDTPVPCLVPALSWLLPPQDPRAGGILRNVRWVWGAAELTHLRAHPGAAAYPPPKGSPAADLGLPPPTHLLSMPVGAHMPVSVHSHWTGPPVSPSRGQAQSPVGA